MIRALVSEIATDLGISGLEISVVEGHRIGCLDADLVYLMLNGTKSLLLAHHYELALINTGEPCLSLEERIRSILANVLKQPASTEIIC